MFCRMLRWVAGVVYLFHNVTETRKEVKQIMATLAELNDAVMALTDSVHHMNDSVDAVNDHIAHMAAPDVQAEVDAVHAVAADLAIVQSKLDAILAPPPVP